MEVIKKSVVLYQVIGGYFHEPFEIYFATFDKDKAIKYAENLPAKINRPGWDDDYVEVMSIEVNKQEPKQETIWEWHRP